MGLLLLQLPCAYHCVCVTEVALLQLYTKSFVHRALPNGKEPVIKREKPNEHWM